MAGLVFFLGLLGAPVSAGVAAVASGSCLWISEVPTQQWDARTSQECVPDSGRPARSVAGQADCHPPSRWPQMLPCQVWGLSLCFEKDLIFVNFISPKGFN